MANTDIRSTPPHSDWLIPDAAAREASVGKRTIYREIAAGRLKAARIGGRREIRIHRDWLHAWLTALAEG